MSWQIEDEQTCGGQNLAVSSTDVKGSVWGCSQSSQDKGHLYWFSCTVATGEHRTKSVWLNRAFIQHIMLRHKTAQLQVYFLRINEMLRGLPQPQLSETVMWHLWWLHILQGKKMYTSREYSRTTLESDFQEMARTIIFSTMLNNQEPQRFVISVYFVLYKNESLFSFAR